MTALKMVEGCIKEVACVYLWLSHSAQVSHWCISLQVTDVLISKYSGNIVIQALVLQWDYRYGMWGSALLSCDGRLYIAVPPAIVTLKGRLLMY